MADTQTKNLGEAARVTSMRRQDALYIEVDGSTRRIKMSDFIEALNEGQSQLLHEVAWGIPILDELQTSPQWGMVGNTAAYAAYKSRCGRYLMDANGRAAKLHKNASDLFADGAPLDETKGSVMVIAPRLYYLYLVDAETSVPYLWMSEQPISEHFIGEAGNGQFNVIGAYKGSVAGGALVSRSGVDMDGSKNITAYWNAAKAFGPNFGIVSYKLWQLMCMLCLCETGGNANIQAGIGMGVGGSGINWSLVTASTTLRKTGGTKTLGDATGAVPIVDPDAKADSCHVSVLGIENFWNQQFEFIQNVFCGNSGNDGRDGTEIFIYEGNRLPTAAELAATPSGAFRQLTRLTTSGYIKSLLKGEYFDVFAKALGGASNSNLCDYNYANNTGQVLAVGGHATYGPNSGPFCANSGNGWSVASLNFGARPAYYGQVTLVDGAALQ